MTIDTQETAYCQEGKPLDACHVHKRPSFSASEETIGMQIHEILAERMNVEGECKRRYTRTCPHYVSEPDYRGFAGELEDVEGEKIRRQSTFEIKHLIDFFTLFGVALTLPVSFIGSEDEHPFVVFLLAWLALSGITHLISLCNRHWFGRLVTVLNKEGIYMNTKKIPWEEIMKITYVEKMPSTLPGDSFIQNSYIRVECNDEQEYRIYHPSYYLLKKIKEYAPNIEMCARSIRNHRLFWYGLMLGAFVLSFIFLPQVI